MPIYEYRCPKCGNPREIILPMYERNNPQECICGEIMTRIMSIPRPPVMVVTNRDTLVDTLNDQENARHLPGRPADKARYKSAIAKSLTREKPTIGRGFSAK